MITVARANPLGAIKGKPIGKQVFDEANGKRDYKAFIILHSVG